MTEPAIECQNCGEALKNLTPDEAQKVARNPERYIVFCRECGKDEMQKLKDDL